MWNSNMDKAPKDRVIHLYDKTRYVSVAVGYFEHNENEWVMLDEDGEFSYGGQPTEWQDQPEPPMPASPFVSDNDAPDYLTP